MKRIFKQAVCAALIIPMLQAAALSSAESCTAWAAAGDRVSNGGILLAKNRDWEPERNELKLVTPEKGFRYMGLLALQPDGSRWVVAGINEKELVVISTTASSIPRKERLTGARGLDEKVLANCDSVDSVIRHRDMLSESHPVFLMLADKSGIACVEIAPEGRIAVKTTNSGTLCHTNHYIDSHLLWANRKIGSSSSSRLDRIEQLLAEHSSPLTLEDFVRFSEDRNDGPDESIWRTGSRPGKTRTLASWIVSIPEKGVPSLYLKLANPGETEKMYRLQIDETLWTKGWSETGAAFHQ
jgi:hypothetical protein